MKYRKHMNMKAGLFITTLSALIFISACHATNKDSYILSGQIANADQLESIALFEGNTFVDSIALDKDGNFRMEATAAEPTLYELVVAEHTFMLVLQNGEKVELNIDLQNPEEYTVTGSETSGKLKIITGMRDKFQAQQVALQREYEQRVGSGEDRSVVQHDLIVKNNVFTSELSKEVLEFSRTNEDNLAGFFGMLILYSTDETEHEEILVEYAEKAKSLFPNNETVQSFVAYMEQVKPLSIGQVAPDFGSLTPDGKEIKLSDLRGQYVLLDFWAAWCTPCRHENPNIVSQYHAFKDRGFTVLGVSLDQDRDAWLKAIEDDKLDWAHVSELKMWDSTAGRLYNITAIPASFMIDPEGKIIGKNLRGPALKQFLEKHL